MGMTAEELALLKERDERETALIHAVIDDVWLNAVKALRSVIHDNPALLATVLSAVSKAVSEVEQQHAK